jgi:CHAD domain-containing protein
MTDARPTRAAALSRESPLPGEGTPAGLDDYVFERAEDRRKQKVNHARANAQRRGRPLPGTIGKTVDKSSAARQAVTWAPSGQRGAGGPHKRIRSREGNSTRAEAGGPSPIIEASSGSRGIIVQGPGGWSAVREREVKLAVDESFELPELDDTVDGARPEESVDKTTCDIYYDTTDLRLARWGCTMRHRQGKGWTVKLPVKSKGRLVVRDEIDFEGPAPTPPAPALDLVSSLTRTALVHIVARFETERHQRSWFAEDGTLAFEVTDDHVVAWTAEGEDVRFRQLEIELGPDADEAALDPVVDLLIAAGARPDDGLKLHRAIGAPAVAAPDVVPNELGTQPTARAVIQAAIARAVAQLLSQLPVARLGRDVEGVHQARVAVRRLRSDLRTFKPLLDRSWIAGVQGDLRALAAALGAIRDTDVLLPRLRRTVERHPEVESEAAERVLRLLEEERRAARVALLDLLGEESTYTLLDELVRVAADPPTAPQADDPASDRLPPLVRKRWRDLDRAARALGPKPEVAALHDVRILAKRARYAAEAVAPAFGPDARRFTNAMARIQDLLGELNDAAVAVTWLNGAAARLDREAAFTAGQLAQILSSEAHAPKRWEQSYSKASKKRLRSWFS